MKGETLSRDPELLRRAAAEMRERFEREDVDDVAEAEFYLAVADLLESTANDVQHVHHPIYNLTSTTVARAFAVAHAYTEWKKADQ